ncbi:MAG TPA: hypothetical protein VK578_02215 [Edaphobacter sp.]|nr:hypothetical protein [Edaphobacter sp.]
MTERPSGILVVTAATMLLFLVAACPASLEANSTHRRISSIAYRFKPITIGEKRSFHVELRFRAVDAVTTIVVPTRWGGAAHLEGQTQNLTALTPGARLEKSVDPGSQKLDAPPGKEVLLSYDIVPLQTEWFHHPQEHAAIINSDYFLFNTENALVYPHLPSTDDVEATFDWRALPSGMPLFSSFGNGKRLQRVRAPWYRVQEALFAGGNFRVTESHENGTTLVLASRGTWKFKDADAFAQIRRIIDEENRFWHVQPMSFFLVTLAPFDDQSGDNDGSGFTDAFMLFLSHEDTFDETRVRLLAHEIFHHWNPMSMGPMAEDEALRWFFEGFTAYYEAVIPLRAVLISYGEYLDYLNRRLREYQTSPLRKLTIAEWQKVSHSSGPGYELSYSRGAALALWADATIRERSEGKSSLDDVMLDLVREAQGSTLPELTEDRIFAALGQYLGPELVTRMRSMAIQGADIPLPRKLGNCAELQRVMRTIVSPGFDEKTSVDTKHIVGVDPDGPAYRAGMRDGQEMFRISIYHDDPSKEVLLGVVVNGQKEMIHYSAAKEQVVDQYRAVVSEDAAKACTPF